MAYIPGTQFDDTLVGSNVSDCISGFQGYDQLITATGLSSSICQYLDPVFRSRFSSISLQHYRKTFNLFRR